MFLILFRLVILLIFVTSNCKSLKNPIVTSNYGEIMGNRKSYAGKFYEEFLGIPFAQPPIDELRWEKPVPASPWYPNVLNATQHQQHCTQMIAHLYPFIGMPADNGEDCLYLNIYVPYGVEANSGRKLPVMVYVYGGAYILGTGEMYPGYALALHGDVIVVTFNYRVSTLGWISTGDSELPGNYGLWDVEATLSWVNKNIGHFGGDSNHVTLFGQSAGAAMTSHAVISPRTNTLFERAIVLSGSSTGFFGLANMPLRLSMLLAQVLECNPLTSTKDIAVCLRKFGAQTLDFWGVVAMLQYEDRLPTMMPVIDGDFIKRPPRESFQLNQGSHINLMTGSLEDDAAGFVLLNPIAFPTRTDTNIAATNESLWQYCRLCLGFTTNTDYLINLFMDRYSGMRSSNVHERTVSTTRAATDWWFGSASHYEARAHARANDASTYHYRFKYRQSFLDAYQPWVNGSHMDDVYSVLGKPFMQTYKRFILREDFNSMDQLLSERIMSYYTNFVHTGNPNVGPNDVSHHWAEYDNEKGNYLQFSENIVSQKLNELELSDYSFWDEFPNLYEFPDEPAFPSTKKITDMELRKMLNNYKRAMLGAFGQSYLDSIENAIYKFTEDRKNGFINNF